MVHLKNITSYISLSLLAVVRLFSLPLFLDDDDDDDDIDEHNVKEVHFVARLTKPFLFGEERHRRM